MPNRHDSPTYVIEPEHDSPVGDETLGGTLA
jgi:hypothetical protein